VNIGLVVGVNICVVRARSACSDARPPRSIAIAASVILLAAILPHVKLTYNRGDFSSRNDIAPRFSRLRRRELPSKTIAKNIEQIITYPHSDSKRFEKPWPLEAR